MPREDKFDALPYEVNVTNTPQPQHYEAWLSEQKSMKLKEIATLFKWDVKDGKLGDTEADFNSFVYSFYEAAVKAGWAITTKEDPFELLPEEIRNWFSGLDQDQHSALQDAFSNDSRYPEMEYASFVQEVYEINMNREPLSIVDALNEELDMFISNGQMSETTAQLIDDEANFLDQSFGENGSHEWLYTNADELKEYLLADFKEAAEEGFDKLGKYASNEQLNSLEEVLNAINFQQAYEYIKHVADCMEKAVAESDQ